MFTKVFSEHRALEKHFEAKQATDNNINLRIRIARGDN
jgi:hypothetical protein